MCVRCSSMRCGSCNAAVSHTLKNFVGTANITNGRKSARLTELTELTDSRTSSDSFADSVYALLWYTGAVCTAQHCRHDGTGTGVTGHDATRLGSCENAIHQASNLLYCTVMETLLFDQNKPINDLGSAPEFPRKKQ